MRGRRSAMRRGWRRWPGLGVDVLVELGPRPVLGPLALGLLAWGATAPVALSSLQPGVADERALSEAVGGALCGRAARSTSGRGRRVGGGGGSRCRAIRSSGCGTGSRRRSAARVRRVSLLLGVEHRSASGEMSWTQELSATEPGWTADHAVFGGGGGSWSAACLPGGGDGGVSGRGSGRGDPRAAGR